MPHFNDAMKAEYEDLYGKSSIQPQHLGEVDLVVNRIQGHLDLEYKEIQDKIGVPNFVVGIIHFREASGNFHCHLHNGDPLTGRTVHVPAGRPPTGSPPFTWVESAIDALAADQHLDSWHDWSIGGICFVLERYNGFGYRNHGVNSPYLWGYTTAYVSGMYVSDGIWDPNAVNRNPGGIAILKRLVDKGFVKIGEENSPPTSLVPSSVPIPVRSGLDRRKDIQKILSEGNLYKGQIDGIFGPQSRKALQELLSINP